MHKKMQGRVFAIAGMIALGLIGAIVSTASAQWLESGVAIATNKNVEVGEHTADETLDIPSKNLFKLCQTVGGSTIKLIAGSLTQGSGSVTMSECEVFSGGVSQKNCQVDDITLEGKAALIQHSGRTYFLLEPVSAGGNFATVIFLGELCALPEINIIKGSLVAECLNASLEEVDCLTPTTTRYLREALNAASLFSSSGIRYGTGEVAANLLGVVTAKLSSGNSWSGHL